VVHLINACEGPTNPINISTPPQEVAQLAEITHNKAEVPSSNLSSPSYVDMSKKKKKNISTPICDKSHI
jgi:hypothetical protein